VRGALSDGEWELLAEVMRPRPEVRLSVSGQLLEGAPVTDLDFLRFFPWLQGLLVSPSELQNLDGLTHLQQLRTLHIVNERLHRLCAVPLAALAGSLRHLFLWGPVSHVDALSRLTGLITLTLRSVSVPDLSALAPMALAELQGACGEQLMSKG
jgi:hypothetical protein